MHIREGTFREHHYLEPDYLVLLSSSTTRVLWPDLGMSSHRLMSSPVTSQQCLQPYLVMDHEHSDSGYTRNYGIKYALQHGYPHIPNYPIPNASPLP